MSLDFSVWQPISEEKPRILKSIWDYCKGTLDLCGKGEESQEANALYLKVSNNDLKFVKEDVQEFFADLFYSVSGDIEKYYDAETVDLIHLTVLPKNQ